MKRMVETKSVPRDKTMDSRLLAIMRHLDAKDRVKIGKVGDEIGLEIEFHPSDKKNRMNRILTETGFLEDAELKPSEEIIAHQAAIFLEGSDTEVAKDRALEYLRRKLDDPKAIRRIKKSLKLMKDLKD